MMPHFSLSGPADIAVSAHRTAGRDIERADLPLLYVAMLITRTGFGAILVVFPVYLQAGGAVLGLILALYPLFEAATAVPLGNLIDRHGRKSVFLAGIIVMAALSAVIGATRDLLTVAVAHAFMGIAAAAVTVSSLTMITDLTQLANRGTGMGVFDFANLGGYATGILLGSRLLEFFPATPGYIFFVVAGVLAIAWVFMLGLLWEPAHDRRFEPVSLNPVAGLDPHTQAYLPLWIALTTLLGLVFFLPKALSESGFTPGRLGGLLFAGAVGLGLAATAFGRLSDRIGRERTAATGVAGMVGLLLALNATYPEFERNLLVIAPFAIASSAVVPSILALVGDRVRSDRRGSAMGLYSLMLSLGIAAGNLIGGVAFDLGGIRFIFLAGLVVLGLAVLGTWALRTRTDT